MSPPSSDVLEPSMVQPVLLPEEQRGPSSRCAHDRVPGAVLGQPGICLSPGLGALSTQGRTHGPADGLVPWSVAPALRSSPDGRREPRSAGPASPLTSAEVLGFHVHQVRVSIHPRHSPGEERAEVGARDAAPGPPAPGWGGALPGTAHYICKGGSEAPSNLPAPPSRENLTEIQARPWAEPGAPGKTPPPSVPSPAPAAAPVLPWGCGLW